MTTDGDIDVTKSLVEFIYWKLPHTIFVSLSVYNALLNAPEMVSIYDPAKEEYEHFIFGLKVIVDDSLQDHHFRLE